MKTMRILFIILLSLMYVSQWVTIAHQSIELGTRRIPEERLIELLEQSRLSEHRLTAVAAQNGELTSQTQAILKRLAAPVPASNSAPTSAITLCHEPDQPLVIYEAEPVKAPAKKGRRQ